MTEHCGQIESAYLRLRSARQRRQLSCISLKGVVRDIHTVIFLATRSFGMPHLDTRCIQSGSPTRLSSYTFYVEKGPKQKHSSMLCADGEEKKSRFHATRYYIHSSSLLTTTYRVDAFVKNQLVRFPVGQISLKPCSRPRSAKNSYQKSSHHLAVLLRVGQQSWHTPCRWTQPVEAQMRLPRLLHEAAWRSDQSSMTLHWHSFALIVASITVRP
jgi:hypothetical protein